MQPDPVDAAQNQQDKSAQTRLKQWLLFLLVPFLIGGGIGAYYGYHYQWDDIHVRHPGAFQYMSEADSQKSCWESAELVAALVGVPSGLLSLAGYGLYRLVMKRKATTN